MRNRGDGVEALRSCQAEEEEKNKGSNRPSSKPDEDPAQPQSSLVQVCFKAVGSAPIMRRCRFFVDGQKPVSSLVAFLRGELRIEEPNDLFLYCDSSFQPEPDASVHELFECFGTRNELVVHYACVSAYG